jgi:hypothetical protein
MVDLELLANQLRAYGHTVTNHFKVPQNAGEYEIVVDGNTLTLEEARALLAGDEETGPPQHRPVLPL